MNSIATSRYVLGISVGAALLAACGVLPRSLSKGQDDMQLPGAIPQTSVHHLSGSYQQLYRFHPSPTGKHPSAGLLDVSGTLYGTTEHGGISDQGTVYSISTSGVHKVLYRFQGGSDGWRPDAGLIDVDGTLYGTTIFGGSANDGTVYSISTSSAEKVLYAFQGGSDGAYPFSLLDVNGTLYGTTGGGGGYTCNTDGPTCGTVFSVTTSGQETVLHRFADGSDGAKPFGALIDVKGLLYGTTAQGGDGGASGNLGTVFSITTAGVEKVLYAFQGGSDGAAPQSGLIDVNGLLYGTTSYGGQVECYSFSCGTVYRISTKGAEQVIYRFAGGSGGRNPQAGLTDLNGTLYGMASGGASKLGAVYSVTTAGVENVLHSFAGGSDGSDPVAPLTSVNGTLYGTTYNGGSKGRADKVGLGTVFALTP